MNFYCQSCFKKSEYKFSKPKFCPNCGKSLSASAILNVSQNEPCTIGVNQPSDFKNKEEKIKNLEAELRAYKRLELSNRINRVESGSSVDIAEDEESEDESFDSNSALWKNSPDLHKSISVEFDRGAKFGVKMSDVAGSSSEFDVSEFDQFSNLKRPSAKQIDTEKILEELKAESSSQARLIDIE